MLRRQAFVRSWLRRCASCLASQQQRFVISASGCGPIRLIPCLCLDLCQAYAVLPSPLDMGQPG